MKKILLSVALSGVVLAALPTSLLATIINTAAVVDGRTNIFVAGQGSDPTGGGIVPGASLSFSAGAGQTVSFSVTGTTTCGGGPCSPVGGIGADGANLLFPTGPGSPPVINTPPIPTDISGNGTNGISGIQFAGREMFLVGVFLDGNVPAGSGPFSPSFVSTGGIYNADTDTLFQPFFLGQVFFIGDGKTSGAATQTWMIPTNATRLFLGFADAFNNFTGAFGAFGDNGGSLNVALTANLNTPEPGTIMLMGLGLAGLALLRKKIA